MPLQVTATYTLSSLNNMFACDRSNCFLCLSSGLNCCHCRI
ncbi:unnamed protein product [Brassica rapa]|uniref:Uncharacterized protein n=2 Tax=Brassica TaxID=3705 RepID=A0A8D9G133_BRACM|nr:unnamed protein product [Brassica napus]CAG7865440.1 unnamed protein product [Brassica rapa]